jgi:O-antigen polymerase
MQSCPIIGYFLADNEYYLQTQFYFPVIINSVFSLILLISTKKITITSNHAVFIVIFSCCVLNLLFSNSLQSQTDVLKAIFFQNVLIILFFQDSDTNHSNKMLLITIVAFFPILQLLMAVYGLLSGNQHVFASSFQNNLLGSFYNPAFFTNYLLLFLPLWVFFVAISRKNTMKFSNILAIILLVLAIASFIYNKNRTGIFTVTVLSCYYAVIYTKSLKNKWLTIILSVSISIAGLYLIQKKESTIGRLLILKITTEIIKENPVFGIGINNFPKEYSNYQAEYFKYNQNPKERLLADDTQVANSELFQLTSEFGLTLLPLLFIIMLFLRRIGFLRKTADNDFDYHLSVSREAFMIVVVCLALINNPFRIPGVVYAISSLFVFYLVTAKLSLGKVILSSKQFVEVAIFLAGYMCFGLYQQYQLYNWLDHSKKYLAGVIEPFDYNQKSLRYNYPYLYTTSMELFYQDNNKESIRQLEKLQNIKTDSKIETMLGKNYTTLGKRKEALIHYQKAHYMNPKLFVPQYLVMNELLLMNDTISAKVQAKKILVSPIKISSDDVDYIRKKASEVLKY